MAEFVVYEGTDWISTLVLGEVYDRWRLDDYNIYAQVRAVGSDVVVLDLSTFDGTLVVSDPLARRMEINVGWTAIEELPPARYEFDLLLENKTTDVKTRSGPHAIDIVRGITSMES